MDMNTDIMHRSKHIFWLLTMIASILTIIMIPVNIFNLGDLLQICDTDQEYRFFSYYVYASIVSGLMFIRIILAIEIRRDRYINAYICRLVVTMINIISLQTSIIMLSWGCILIIISYRCLILFWRFAQYHFIAFSMTIGYIMFMVVYQLILLCNRNIALDVLSQYPPLIQDR